MKTKDYLDKLIRDYNSRNSELNVTASLYVTFHGNIIVEDYLFDKSDLKGLLKCSDFRMIHPENDNSLYISVG